MKTILILGAGKSSTILIEYLLQQASINKWEVIVADQNIQHAKEKIKNHPCGKAIELKLNRSSERIQYIQQATIVISLLPPALHYIVAQDCVQFNKHLLTASYVDEKIKALEKEIIKKNLLFLCEMGLDPGIDHMSAMQIINQLKQEGAQINSFISHCGGLVAPESDDNPWHYKVSWNPQNVVLAGKNGAIYKENNEIKQIDYHHLFDPQKLVDIPNAGTWGWYPNRDSLSYAKLYQLENTSSFIRTTLRHPDFIYGWKFLVDNGFTKHYGYDTTNMSYADFFKLHLKNIPQDQKLHYLLQALGNDDHTLINKGVCTSDYILQSIIEKKWALQPNDKDMIIMMHDIQYTINNKAQQLKSCLVVKGENSTHTAMAKTVGLPLAIATTLILQGKLKLRGLHIPISREVYDPVLKSLADQEIKFKDYTNSYK